MLPGADVSFFLSVPVLLPSPPGDDPDALPAAEPLAEPLADPLGVPGVPGVGLVVGPLWVRSFLVPVEEPSPPLFPHAASADTAAAVMTAAKDFLINITSPLGEVGHRYDSHLLQRFVEI